MERRQQLTDVINAEIVVQQLLRHEYTNPTIQSLSNELEMFFIRLLKEEEDEVVRCYKSCLNLINDNTNLIEEEMGDLKGEFLGFERKGEVLMKEYL